MSCQLAFVHRGLQLRGGAASVVDTPDDQLLEFCDVESRLLAGGEPVFVGLVVSDLGSFALSRLRDGLPPSAIVEEWLDKAQAALRLHIEHGEVTALLWERDVAILLEHCASAAEVIEEIGRRSYSDDPDPYHALGTSLGVQLLQCVPDGATVYDALEGLCRPGSPGNGLGVVERAMSALAEIVLNIVPGAEQQLTVARDRNRELEAACAALEKEVERTRKREAAARADLDACQRRLADNLVLVAEQGESLEALRAELARLTPEVSALRRSLQSSQANEAEWRRSALVYAREVDRLGSEIEFLSALPGSSAEKGEISNEPPQNEGVGDGQPEPATPVRDKPGPETSRPGLRHRLLGWPIVGRD